MLKKLTLSFCAVLLLFSGIRLQAQSTQTGDLSAYVDSYISGLPGIGTNAYQIPSIAALATWGRVITDIIAGSYASAHSRADSISYRLIQYTDNGAAPNRTYYVLTRKTGSTNYWGMFIYNPSSSRTKLFIMAPHPKYDSNTGTQGFYIFKNVNARAFIISGTHRCNNADSSDCDGTTTACDGGSKYKISDQAHNVAATFQRTTEIMLNTIANLIIIQPHGFGKDAGDPDLIMSNGTRTLPSTDFLRMVKDELFTIDNSLTFKLAHIDTAWTRLIATTNTAGRLLNGSNDPCYTSASTGNGRFLHIEQALTGLRDNSTNRKKLSDAIAAAFPENSTVASGNWNSLDTWMRGAVPKSTEDVIITEGTTVNVTASTDSCKNITFGSATAKLSFAANSILNITGDFTLAASSHAAISSWGTGAKIKFTGSAATQTLSGWSTSGFSTSLPDIIIDKSSGKVTTQGNGMRFSFASSLMITSGTFELDTADDIETRDINGSAASGAITVGSNGILKVLGGDSYIRKGASTDTVSSRIGKMTISGAVYLACQNSNRLNFNGIDVENGGVLQLTTGWTGASGYFNPGTVLVKSGGLLTNYTTQTLWHSSAYLAIQSGGKLDVYSSTIGLPNLLTVQGDVWYSRTSSQTLSSKIASYNNLFLAGSSTKTLAANTTVNGTLTMTGKASLASGGFVLSYGSGAALKYSSTDTSQTTSSAEFPAVNGPANLVINNNAGVSLHAARTINGALTLQSGTFNNSSFPLTIGNGGTIYRSDTGQVAASPQFAGTCDVHYTNTSLLTTGAELPSATSVLNILALEGTAGIQLSTSTTVNGQLSLNGLTLNTAANTLNFSASSLPPTENSTGYITGTAHMLQRPVGTDTLRFLGCALRGTGNAGSVELRRVTGSSVQGSENQSIASRWELTSTEGIITGKTAEFSWLSPFDNNKSFSETNRGQCWTSTNNGTSWHTSGWPAYVGFSLRSITVPVTGSAYFTVSDSLHPLEPTLYAEILNEAMWNGTAAVRDTFRMEVRSQTAPYAVISTSAALSDNLGRIAFQFSGTQNGTGYYLTASHRNSIRVWSHAAQQFNAGVKGFSFAAAQSNTFGSNTILKYGKYCVYSGDTNQDGIVDFSDLSAVDNASLSFMTGYISEDLNGDEFVDFTDLIQADNNSNAYISEITPP